MRLFAALSEIFRYSVFMCCFPKNLTCDVMFFIIKYNRGGEVLESRLFKIFYYLLDKGKATAPELSKLFEVSTRTIYRDIDALSAAGIPIYAMNGRNGGIQLLDNFILNKSALSKQEQEEILLGLQSLNAIQYPEANDILIKLGALFQINAQSWIEVDLSRWGSVEKCDKDLFHLLKKAVLEKLRIQFVYFNSLGDKTCRQIEPMKLVYKDKAWYVFGFCLTRNDWRVFKISRIKNLNILEEHFSRVIDEKVSIRINPEAHGTVTPLELLFSAEVAYRLYDILDDNTIKKENDFIRVSLSVYEDEWMYEFLMSFGDKVTVIKPIHIKIELVRRHE